MKFKTFTAVSLTSGLLGLSSYAFAAAGDSTLIGSASPSIVVKSVGNDNIGLLYVDSVGASYLQSPSASGGPQIIELRGRTSRDFVGYLLGDRFRIVALKAEAHGRREGSHMNGYVNGRLVYKDSVIWEDARDYDVTAWAGSEAEIAKSERIFSYDSGVVRTTVVVAGIPVTFGAGFSGSVSLSAGALSDFNSNDGRHGRAHASTAGTAQAEVVIVGGVGIPHIGGGEVYHSTKFTIGYPAFGAALWDYSAALPIDSRNSYRGLAILNLSGSAEGEFGVQLFGPGKVTVAEKKLGTWSFPDLFKAVVKQTVKTDVGRYE
jgi:hypothetical protein